MTNVAKISIALTEEMAELLQQAVRSGDYASSSEVVREALREWKQRRTSHQRERADILELWTEGLTSGPGRFEDIDAIKAQARRGMTATRRKKAD